MLITSLRDKRTLKSGARVPRALVAVAAVGLILAACGGENFGSTTAPAPAPAPSPSPAEPERDLVFTAALPTIVSNIDPAAYQGTPSTEVEGAWSGTLFEFVEPSGISEELRGLTGLGSVAPLLVESEQQEEDGSLILTLKSGVTSFYGNTLTAEDVKWTFERVVARDFVGRFVMSVGEIDQENPVTVIDDLTFRLNVLQPNPYVRGVLTLWDLSPLDSIEVKKHATSDDPWAAEWLTENSATFGPYHVEAFTPGERVVLIANSGWPGPAPAYQRVLMQQVPDASVRLQLLQAGEVDYAAGLQPDQFAGLQGAANVTTKTRLANRIVALELNFRFEAFQDARVRQAIAYAIDRDAFVQGPMRGFAKPLGNQLLSSLQQPAAPSPYTYDPARARALLAEAGYATGLSFPFAINLTRPGPYAEQIAVILQSQLRDVGIEIQIETIASSPEFEEKKTSGQLIAWLGANTPIVPDTWYFMQLEHHSTLAFQNWKAFNDAEFDQMLADLRFMPLGAGRDAQISMMHEFLMANVPWVPMFEEYIPVAVGSDVDIASVRQYSPYGPILREIRPN